MFSKKLTVDFSCSDHLVEGLPSPQPSTKFFPSWVKNLGSCEDKDYNNVKVPYVSRNGNLQGNQTIKKCVPVTDMMGAGYTIPLWMTMVVEKTEESIHFNWGLSNEKDRVPLASHHIDQVRNSFLAEQGHGNQIFKLTSPWRITTPKGVSCLLISPFYSNPPLKILPAIVDTDQQHEINFPFLYNPEIGDHIIDAGTPLVQVIPFRRETWVGKISSFPHTLWEKEDAKYNSKLYDVYRRMFHSKKKYLMEKKGASN